MKYSFSEFPYSESKFTLNIFQDAKNSAMLGSAYQAKHGLFSNSSSFEEITKNAPQPQVICTPYSDANSVINQSR